MRRRDFAKTVASALAIVAVSEAPWVLPRQRTPALNLNAARLSRHLKELSAFGANPQGGVSRVAFSDADRAGRAFTIDRMRAAGLDTRVDFAGNIFGRRAGTD